METPDADYKMLFDQTPGPMWIYDRETNRILDCNDAALALGGYTRDEFLSLDARGLLITHDCDRAGSSGRPAASCGTLKQLVRASQPAIFVETRTRDLVFQGRPARLVFAIDACDRRRLEEDLLQSQKMQAVGTLAGGIAHDFNNLLTAIIGYSQILRAEIGDEGPVAAKVAQIEMAGERAAALTRQLLEFSRKDNGHAKPVDLNAVVRDTQNMLSRVIRENIDLATCLDPNLSPVLAEPSRVMQVLVNLAVNAGDAMPFGGRLLVETGNVRFDLDCHPEVPEGDYCMIAVSDTGCGIEESIRDKIFEPFFTTKERGKGTGLGLSITHNIVKRCGGTISVYSETGNGTVFKVYLPSARQTRRREAEAACSMAAAQGSETILLVEDDAKVRRLASETLESCGYSLLEAADGEEGLRVCRTYDGDIDLVIADAVMPVMSGMELADAVATARPAIQTLFISGYTEEGLKRAFGMRGPFLEKPFTPFALARRVRDVLDRAHPRVLARA